MVVLLFILESRQTSLAHLDALAVSPLEVIEGLRCRVRCLAAGGTGDPGAAVIGAGPRWLLLLVLLVLPRIRIVGGGMRRNLAILFVAVVAHGFAGRKLCRVCGGEVSTKMRVKAGKKLHLFALKISHKAQPRKPSNCISSSVHPGTRLYGVFRPSM